MALEHLLKPASVAVVGATDRPHTFGNYGAKSVMKSKDVRGYLVNPNRAEVLGIATYPSLTDLPEVVDCVVIATPREIALESFRQAAELGVKAAVVYASGFGEENTPEAQALEAEICEIARIHDVTLLGPNCSGLINNFDKINMWGMLGGAFDMETRGTGIALIAQSGAVCIYVLSMPHIDLTFAISTGNGNLTTIDEMIEYCVDHSAVNVVAVYMEGIKKPLVFEQALKKAALKKKPVVILKAGKSAGGAKSAASHTGNLAGSAKAFEAAFERFGVVQVDNLEELFATAQALNVLSRKMPKKNAFAMINSSGGETTIAADMAERIGINMPDYTEETREQMRQYLPSYGNPMNPLDCTFSNAYNAVNLMGIMGRDPSFGALLLGGQASLEAVGPRSIAQSENSGKDFHEHQATPLLNYAATEGSLPMMIIPPFEDRRHLEWRQKVEKQGIAMLSCSELGFKELRNIGAFVDYSTDGRTLSLSIPRASPGEKTRTLSELESKELIREEGVPVTRHINVTSEEQLTQALDDLRSPYVLKVNSPDILHKSDIGGVRLNIKDSEAALSAYHEIQENCRLHMPNARIDGILVQEMAPNGTEIIIGINNDPILGPMLLVGLGGVSVELYKDTVISPCPVNRQEALDMLCKLKAYPLLAGYRGSRPLDTAALADVMVKVSEYAARERNSLKEMDLNPVIVYEQGEGLRAVDAVIVQYIDA